MEIDQGIDINVCNPVAVGETKVVIAKMISHAPQPTTGHRVFTRIHKRHLPGFGASGMDLYLVRIHVKRDVRHVQEVVGKIFFDEITAMPETNDEIVNPIVRIDFHDVPKNWAAADFDHRLWPHTGFLAN